MPLRKGNKRRLGKGPKEKEVAIVLHGLPSNLINNTIVLTKEVYEAIDNAKKPKLNNARDLPIEASSQRNISTSSANDSSTEICLGENTSIYSANGIEAFHRDDTSTYLSNGKTINAPISTANNYTEEARLKENTSMNLTNGQPTQEKTSIFTIVHTDTENCPSTEATTSAMNTSRDNHECPICNRRFNFLSRLQKHMLSHSVDKPYKCSSCPASFVDMHSLNRHSFSHSKNYPYKCEICCNIYINKLDYSNHMLGHNGEDPYKCKKCPQKFKHAKALSRHNKVAHSGLTPYPCQVCDEAFPTYTIMLEHRKIHADYKPYICEICDKTYSKSVSLLEHYGLHTGLKFYKCNVCGKGFGYSSSLRKHILLTDACRNKIKRDSDKNSQRSVSVVVVKSTNFQDDGDFQNRSNNSTYSMKSENSNFIFEPPLTHVISKS